MQIVSACMSAAGLTNESTRIRALHRDSAYVYVTPMFHQFDPAVSGSRAAYYSGAGEFGAAYDLFVARQVTQSLYYQLGSTDFPAILVSDEAVKTQIEADFFWQYRESDANGFVSIDGESYYRGVTGPYLIYVRPAGLGDWAGSAPDAPLLSCWIAWQMLGVMDEEDVRERTSEFYRDFFGLQLDTDALDAILSPAAP